MIVAATLLLAAQGAALPPERVDSSQPIQVFIDVCANGGGRFAPDALQSVAADAVPPAVRKLEKQAGSFVHYRLTGASEAYLSLPSGPRHDVCRVTAKDIRIAPAIEQVTGRTLTLSPGMSLYQLGAYRRILCSGTIVKLSREGGFVMMEARAPGTIPGDEAPLALPTDCPPDSPVYRK
jgi:hypothetical protein